MGYVFHILKVWDGVLLAVQVSRFRVISFYYVGIALLSVNIPYYRQFLNDKEVFRRQIYRQLVDLDRAHLLVCVLKRQFIHPCAYKVVYSLYLAIL